MDKKRNSLIIEGELYDPRHRNAVIPVYCDNDKKYEPGMEFYKLDKTERKTAIEAIPFKIGDYIETKAEVNSANPKTRSGYYLPIGEAKVIDLLKNKDKWFARVQYLLCKSYNGNRWLYYSDIEINRCTIKNESI